MDIADSREVGSGIVIGDTVRTALQSSSAHFFGTRTRAALRAVALMAFLSVQSLQCCIAHAAEIKTVRLAHWGQSKVFIYLPLYVANDLGYFRDEGIDIQIVYSGNDDQVFAAVVGGSAIAGFADPAFAGISRERGENGRAIAVLVNRVSNWGIGKDSSMAGFKFPQDLNGKRISSFPSPSTAYSILKDIKTKFALDQMQIVELAPGTEVAALQRGAIDIALTGEPAVSIAEENGFPVVLSLANYYGPFAFSGITTTDDNIKRFPQELQALVSGLQRALEFMRANPSETVDVAARNFPDIPRPVIQRAVKRLVDEESIPKSVQVTADAWSRTMQLRKEISDLKTDQHSDAVDNTFADIAVNPAPRERARVERLAAWDSADQKPVPTENELAGFAWWKYWIEFFGAIASIVALVPIFWAAIDILSWHNYLRRMEQFRREPYRKMVRRLIELIGTPGSTMAMTRIVDDLATRRICDNQSANKHLEELIGAKFIDKIRTAEGEMELRLRVRDGKPLIAPIAY
jgi:NitT/TauT family transport system substrate-binding protein